MLNQIKMYLFSCDFVTQSPTVATPWGRSLKLLNSSFVPAVGQNMTEEAENSELQEPELVASIA